MDIETVKGLWMVLLAVALPCLVFLVFAALSWGGMLDDERRERGERRWRGCRGR